MIDVSYAVVVRMNAQVGSQFSFIGTVADFAALDNVPRTVPAAYVIPQTERAEPADVIGANAQTHTAIFSVLFLVRHAGDGSGAKVMLSLDTLRRATHDAIVGWVPPDCFDVVQFVSGALDGELIGGGVVAWRDDFSVRRRVTH